EADLDVVGMSELDAFELVANHVVEVVDEIFHVCLLEAGGGGESASPSQSWLRRERELPRPTSRRYHPRSAPPPGSKRNPSRSRACRGSEGWRARSGARGHEPG